MCFYLNYMYLYVIYIYKISNIFSKVENKKLFKLCCIIFLVILMYFDIINGKNYLFL